MVLAIAAGVIVGAIGLAALYDYVAKRRHGWNIGVTADEPMMNVIDKTHLHPDPFTEGPRTATEIERDL